MTDQTKQTHTPGPWDVANNHNGHYQVWQTARECQSFPQSIALTTHRGPLEEEANARLIAAAPDLLADLIEAVQTIEALYDPADDDDPAPIMIAKWRAHIAKARGEQEDK